METAAPMAVAAKRNQDCWTAAPRFDCITIMAVIAAQYGCGRRSSSAKYMARQPASAVFNASRKFAEEMVIFLGGRVGWIMDRERVDAIEADAPCRIGAEKWGQHQLRHRDRTSPGLCKVLHIEKRGQKVGPRCSSVQRAYF